MTTASIIGDSQGGGLAEIGGLNNLLRAKGITPLRYFFRNGASTSRLLTDLSEILSPTPEYVIVAAGGNDNASSEAAWTSMYNQLVSAGVQHIYWIGPPASPDAAVDAVRATVSRAQQNLFSSKDRITWISGRLTASGLPRRDDVHLTADGYREWSRRLASIIAGESALPALAITGLLLWVGWKVVDRYTR